MNNTILWEEKNLTEPEKSCLNNNEKEQNDTTKAIKKSSTENTWKDTGKGKVRKRVPYKEEDFLRNCPSCGSVIVHTNVYERRKSEKKGRVCKICLKVIMSQKMVGKVHSEETKNKLSIISKGRIMSSKQKEEISKKALQRYKNPNYKKHWVGKNNPNFGRGLFGKDNPRYGKKIPGMHSLTTKIKSSIRMSGKNNPYYGKRHTDEVREKMRNSALDRLRKVGKVKIGINECEYLDKLSLERGWKIQHGKNGEQFRVCGYSVDGYDRERNIVIEYDEPHHYDVYGNLQTKDIDRMNKIIQHLNCKFYRYNEITKTLNEHN